MSGKVTRGLCVLAAGTALAAFTLVTPGAAGAAPGSARSWAAAETGHPAGAPGSQVWVQRYNGPGNTFDEASSVAVSPGGSRVFVTGASRGTRSGADYATVAYSAATGARLWAARYNGPATYDDAARSVAVSPSGSTVYITDHVVPSAALAGRTSSLRIPFITEHTEMAGWLASLFLRAEVRASGNTLVVQGQDARSLRGFAAG